MHKTSQRCRARPIRPSCAGFTAHFSLWFRWRFPAGNFFFFFFCFPELVHLQKRKINLCQFHYTVCFPAPLRAGPWHLVLFSNTWKFKDVWHVAEYQTFLKFLSVFFVSLRSTFSPSGQVGAHKPKCARQLWRSRWRSSVCVGFLSDSWF